MATVSVDLTPELRDEVERIAREEQRTQGEVVAAALDLYTRLPAAARNALRQLSSAAAAEAANDAGTALVWEITRAIVSARWELATRRLAEEVRASGALPRSRMSEDEIAQLTVAMVSADTDGPVAGAARRAQTRRRRPAGRRKQRPTEPPTVA